MHWTSLEGCSYFVVSKVSLLDPLNEVDLCCLHFIYLPRIGKSLKEFHNSWNCHSLSTEGSKTPHQLFFEGIIASENDESCVQTPTSTAQIEIESSDPVVSSNTIQPCPELQLVTVHWSFTNIDRKWETHIFYSITYSRWITYKSHVHCAMVRIKMINISFYHGISNVTLWLGCTCIRSTNRLDCIHMILECCHLLSPWTSLQTVTKLKKRWYCIHTLRP